MKQQIKNTFYLPGIILLISLITSCTNTKTIDDGFYFQDFDNLKYWQNDASVTNEKAHSGSYAAFTDETHEFSQTFVMEFEYAKLKKYKSMVISAWCYKTTMDPKAGLVATLDSPEKQIAYVSNDLSKTMGEVNQWIQVSTLLELPEQAPEHSKIKIYLWSPGKSKVFMDDVLVEFAK